MCKLRRARIGLIKEYLWIEGGSTYQFNSPLPLQMSDPPILSYWVRCSQEKQWGILDRWKTLPSIEVVTGSKLLVLPLRAS